MRPDRPEPHTMAGAYTMDALDDRDRSRFERHLGRCRECSQEVRGLREATARLATAAAAQPPAAVKERLLAQTTRTRQLPPVTTGALETPMRHLGVPGPGYSHWPRNRRWVWVPRLALASIFFIAAAIIWATGSARQPRLAQEPPRSHAIAAVLTAPDATVISAVVMTGGKATVVMSHHERMLVFAAAGLRTLPASCRYELWLMEQSRDRPAGLLPTPRHGMTGPVIASGLEPGDQLGLTVEPASGSRHPTSEMIMVVNL
jgi:anti-sigma-K factor RskA